MRLLCQGSGDPILFIHGIPTSKRLWDGVIGRLRERYSCYTLDLPGLGEEPGTNFRLGEIIPLVEEIERLRTTAGLERWSMVGHDAGSAIAVLYAHLFPERVDRLALISPALFPDIRPYYLFQVLRRPIVGELIAPCIHPLIWRVAMRRACHGCSPDSETALDAFRSPFRGLLGPWRMMRLLRWGRPSEVLGRFPALLPTLRPPALIFHGANDPAIPVSFAHRTAALIPNSKLTIVDAGHFVPMNCPQIVAQGLDSFMRDQSDASAVPGANSVSCQLLFNGLHNSSKAGERPAVH